jgi:hypothetical protein
MMFELMVTRAEQAPPLNGQGAEARNESLSLALLVPRIAAHDVHDTTTAHDLALVANPLDACLYFHRSTRRGSDRPWQAANLKMAVNA